MASQLPLDQDQILPRQGQQPSPDPLPPHPTPSSAMKTYNMYYTLSRSNVKLHLGSSSTPCIYYGESTFLTTQPQLRLRSGDSKHAPVVAIAKVHWISRHILLGCGNYNEETERSLVWEEMRREKLRLLRSDYEFDTSVGLGPRKTYGWRVAKYWTKTVYRCVDDEGRQVASLLSGGFLCWSKGGEIEIAEGLDKRLEELLIVSALAIWVAEAGWSFSKGY